MKNIRAFGRGVRAIINGADGPVPALITAAACALLPAVVYLLLAGLAGWPV